MATFEQTQQAYFDQCRERFHTLSAAVSALHEQTDPLREELAQIIAGDTDLTVREAREREAQIRAILIERGPQFQALEAERAAMARAIAGPDGVAQTGPLREDARHLAEA